MENETVADPNVSVEVACVETLRSLVWQVQHAYMYGKYFGIRFDLDFPSVYRQFDEIVDRLQEGHRDDAIQLLPELYAVI